MNSIPGYAFLFHCIIVLEWWLEGKLLMELKNKLKSTHTVLSDARKKKTFYTLRLGHFGNFHLDFVVELKLKL